MSDELPATPGATFSQPRGAKDPIVEIELDRRAATLDGIETETCVQCGEAKATVRGALKVRGRLSSLDLRVAICERCREKARVAYQKVGRVERLSRGVYFAQLAALALSMTGPGGSLLFTSMSVLLVGTIGASFVARRRLLRDQPRLMAVAPTTVRLRAPQTWARVLLDEKPRALVRTDATPPALPEAPR